MPKPGKTGRRPKAKSPCFANLLEALAPDEAATVLRGLLARHPELRPEAELLAREIVTSESVEEIADEVFNAVTGIGLDKLSGRAGSHSWGYVEPSQAAVELLEESLEPLLEDMERQGSLGFTASAETICVGIVAGLYRARDTNSEGALGWDPDFPPNHAGYAFGEFLRISKLAAKPDRLKPLLEILAAKAPKWEAMFRSVLDEAAKG